MASPVRSAHTTAPLWAYLVCLLIAGLLTWQIIVLGRHGDWAAVLLLALLSSPGLMLLGKVGLMRDSVAELFDPHRASWAFLADFALAGVVALAASAWPHLVPGQFFTSGWWLLLAIVGGVAASLAWSFGLDRPAYRQTATGTELLGDPTKLIHDNVAYFVLSITLLYLAVPVLGRGDWSTSTPWLMSGLFSLWVLGGVADAVRKQPNFQARSNWGLDIFNLHGIFDWTTFRPIRSAGR
jgi:hypothetical protein